MLGLTPKEVQEILSEIEQAIYFHEQWYYALVRGLVCRLPPDARELRDDAHRQCRFGQWYYQFATAALRRYPGFVALEREHERMHGSAAQLLRLAADGQAISVRDYDLFFNSLERLRLEIFSLKRELEDSLYNLDPLTGTQTRIGMLTRLREQQELVKRGAQSCAIAMIDVDHFKQINDSYGHPAGDSVLRGIARFLMDHLRPYDRLFRYGGEEFFVFMPNTELQTGHHVIERLREGLAGSAVGQSGDGPLKVTVSFGLTLLDPDVSVEESVDRADKALYAAKAAGRNCTRIWDPSME